MKPRERISLAATVLLIGQSVTAAQNDQTITYVGADEKSGTSQAVVVDDRALAHTAQLLPLDAKGQIVHRNSAAAQFEKVLTDLDAALAETGSGLEHLVMLNVYATSTDAVDEVKRRLAQKLGPEVKPAVSFVTTRLPHPDALVAADAVAVVPEPRAQGEVVLRRAAGLPGDPKAAHVSVLPRGEAIYIAGQAEQSDKLAEATRGTLLGLERTLKHYGLGREHIVELKAFLTPMDEVAAVEKEMAQFFSGQSVPPVTYVEWVSNLPIEIEVVAFAPKSNSAEPPADTISYLTPPWMDASPIFSRVARVHGGKRIYISGLYADQAGDGESEVRSIFATLGQVLEKAGSDFNHLAKATYYVSDNDASGKLNKVRPEFYDPKRPPSASKAAVKGVGVPERTITIDMIAVTPP